MLLQQNALLVMAKWTRKERKDGQAGIEKFRLYAEPRGIFLNEASYGLYKVISHSGKISQREAIRAAVKDEETSETILGWVINLANRQRKFVADGEGWRLYPLGKKHLPKEGIFTGPTETILSVEKKVLCVQGEAIKECCIGARTDITDITEKFKKLLSK